MVSNIGTEHNCIIFVLLLLIIKNTVMKKIRSTRYLHLGYTNAGVGRWYFVSTENEYPAQIGSYYITERELLADMNRFAEERGYILL